MKLSRTSRMQENSAQITEYRRAPRHLLLYPSFRPRTPPTPVIPAPCVARVAGICGIFGDPKAKRSVCNECLVCTHLRQSAHRFEATAGFSRKSLGQNDGRTCHNLRQKTCIHRNNAAKVLATLWPMKRARSLCKKYVCSKLSFWVSSSVVEQWPFKPLVVGSSPTSPTRLFF